MTPISPIVTPVIPMMNLVTRSLGLRVQGSGFCCDTALKHG